VIRKALLFGAALAVLTGCTTATPVTTGPVTPPSSASVLSTPTPSPTGSRIGESWDTTTLTPGPGSTLVADTPPPNSTAPEDLGRSTASSTPSSEPEPQQTPTPEEPDAPVESDSSQPTFTVDTAHAVVPSAPDGDTIHAIVDGNEYTVRIIGIDTPETVDPRKPIQCFGPQASDRTKGELTGEVVTLTPDPTQGDKDKYGRLLRYVNLADGTDWGAQLIKEGLAREYKYKTVYERRSTYLGLQDEARRNGTGGWGPAGGGGCGWK